MRNLKNLIIIFVITFLTFNNLGHAFDLDETVDDEIRKNYNDSKLVKDVGIKVENTEEKLPELPNILKQQTVVKPTENKSGNINTPPAKVISYNGGNIKVAKGTVFNVVSSNSVSDWQGRGTKLKFSVKTPIVTKKYTIPAWTSFSGEIIETHQPQITCNGGLVVIHIYSMVYKGQTIPVNAYITKANDKKIFFNDIKGERTYLKTIWKKGNWGRTLFDKMLALTIKLGAEGSTLVLSPFPIAYGTICLGFNTLTSPITAFFSRGGHVSIPAGSNYRIKLIEDIYIN